MAPSSLVVVDGDNTDNALAHELSSRVDNRYIYSDEKFGAGNNPQSRDRENTRQGMNEKTATSEGYIQTAMPVETTDENGGKKFQTMTTMTACRSIRAFNRNELGDTDSPLESRRHGVDIPDPPIEEQRKALMRGGMRKETAHAVSLFGRMCGSNQWLLNFPGHFGLHNAADISKDLLSVAMAVMADVGLSPPLGRSLSQFTWTVRSVTYFRVISECTRFKTAWSVKPLGSNHYSGTPEDWERAFMIQANLVISPSDIIAGMSLYYGCAAEESFIELIFATLVELIEPLYTTTEDDDGVAGRPIFTGFSQHEGKFYVLTAGSVGGRRRGVDPVTELATRVYRNQKSKYGEARSIPVIAEELRKLETKQVGGMPALMVVEHSIEKAGGISHTEQRWAVNQTMLHKTSFPRIERILSAAAQFQDARESATPVPCGLVSPDEKHWLFPADFTDSLSGDILLNPVDYLGNPNDKVRQIANFLIAPIGATQQAREKQQKLDADTYNMWFRFAERCKRVEVSKGNTFTGYTVVSPSVASPTDITSADGKRRLRPITKSGNAVIFNIDACNSAAANLTKPNMFKKAARIIQAISLPPGALDPQTMHKLWFGMEREDGGEKRITVLDQEDLADVSITIDDINYKRDMPGADLFLPDDMDDDDDGGDMEKVWPGTEPEVTFEFGDDLYGRMLRNRWRSFGITGEEFSKYRLSWHIPGWEPASVDENEVEAAESSPKRPRLE